MSPWREHERVDDHIGRTLLYAQSEGFGDRGLCDLHVRRLYDAFGAKALLDQGSDFTDQLVGRGPSAPMVDEEYRGAVTRRPFARAGRAHRAYLGHSLRGVKTCGRGPDLKRSQTARA